MKNFFTSDTHFGHENIIKYCNRPFSSLDEMNNTLVENWNKRVENCDNVFFLGDFCFSKAEKNFNYYKKMLNGNIIFINGNHDSQNSIKSIINGIEIETYDKKIWCTHKPSDSKTTYKINLIGHIHNNWTIKKYENSILFNVGVDVHNFYPITIEEIFNKISYFERENLIETYIPEIYD